MFMNRYVNIGLACGMSAFLGAAVDLSAQAKPQTAKPAMEQSSGRLAAQQIWARSAFRGPSRPTGRRWPPAHIRSASRKHRQRRRLPGRRRSSSGGPSSCATAKSWGAKWSPSSRPATSSRSQSRRHRLPAGYRAEVLKGDDYLRLWINRGGNHYLIHFNI